MANLLPDDDLPALLAMPVDALTGLALGSEGSNPFPELAQDRPAWAPSPLTDVHIGGAIMRVGGAGLIFTIMMTVFFAWTRTTQADGGVGWLETARRTNFAAVVGSRQEKEDGTKPARAATSSEGESVDDEEHLAACNAYLAQLNKSPNRRSSELGFGKTWTNETQPAGTR